MSVLSTDKQHIKKVVFYCDEDIHARFLCKLQYFGFKRQAQFFRLLLNLIADFEDDAVKSFATMIKEKNKTKSKKIIKEIEISENNLYDENLDAGDIDEIYEMLLKGDFLEDDEKLY